MIKSDYRIVREEGILSVREVFYNENDSIDYIGEDHISPIGEDFEEFVEEFELFNEALSLPVVECAGGEYKETEEEA